MRALLLSLVLALPALNAAQDARSIRCRFLSLGSGEESASVIAMSEKGTETICPLSTDSLSSQTTCLATDNKIGFLSSTDHKLAATAAIPADVSSAILIFVKVPGAAQPATTGALPWRVLVIEDSLKNFPDGGAFVANFYSGDIRFVLGEHKGMLHSGGAHGYARPSERDSFNMSSVVFEFLQDDKWRPVSESAIRFLPGMRYLIFAYVDPDSGRPRITTCQDFAPTMTQAP
jgi:hypothetical protein